MRKILLSFLGTSDYVPCNYTLHDFPRVSNVRFVQEALVQWICGEWTSRDELLFFTTEESHDRNWVDNADREGLASRLELLGLDAPLREVQIPLGKSEEEIWEIFRIVSGRFEESDRVFLDITHAFRSLPMLALVLLGYAKVVKNVEVASICYGAMEALGPVGKVREMPVEKRDVPVFELLPFDRLQDWTSSIDRFVSTGDATAVVNLAHRSVHPVLKETRGQDTDAAAIRKFAGELERFAAVRRNCRGLELTETAVALHQALANVRGQSLLNPLQPLLDRLENQVAGAREEDVSQGLSAAQWCCEHGLVQQGLTILQETMITFILTMALGASADDMESRKVVGSAGKIALKNISEKEWKGDAAKFPEKTKEVISWLNGRDRLLALLRNLANFRNDINHCGMRDNPAKHENIKKGLHSSLEEAERIIQSFVKEGRDGNQV
jgi:CRISPR-associated Csx2 family protein